MKIDKVKIKHYRSIGVQDIDFGDVTVITGPSSSGKTNFIRALRDWAFNNTGEDFINVNHNTSSVHVYMSEEDDDTVKKISWIKSRDGANKYQVTEPGSSYLEEYLKVGRGCPPDVHQVTGIREHKIDHGSSYTKLHPNFHFQTDGWFILSWNSSVASKLIASISGVDSVYKSINQVSSDLRKVKREKTIAEKRVKEVEGKLEELPNLEEAEKKLNNAKQIKKVIDKNNSIIDKANSKISLINKTKSDVDHLNDKLLKLKDLRDKFVLPDVDSDIELINEAKRIRDSIENNQSKVSKLINNRDLKKQELKDLKLKLRKILEKEERCPLCGSEFDKDSINHVLGE